jgi:ribonuclease HI
VKDADLRKAYAKVRAILPELRFRFEIKHVPREKNAEADRLANLAIDTRTPLAPGPFPPLPRGGEA